MPRIGRPDLDWPTFTLYLYREKGQCPELDMEPFSRWLLIYLAFSSMVFLASALLDEVRTRGGHRHRPQK